MFYWCQYIVTVFETTNKLHFFAARYLVGYILYIYKYICIWKLWPPQAKSWLIGKDPDAGRDWGQEKKGRTEDEMAGWHHWLIGHEFGWTPGIGDGQGGLVCCGPWGFKESDTTEWLNWTEPWQNRQPGSGIPRGHTAHRNDTLLFTLWLTFLLFYHCYKVSSLNVKLVHQ